MTHSVKLLEAEWVNGQMTDFANLSYAIAVLAMKPHSVKLLDTEWVNGHTTDFQICHMPLVCWQ